MNKRKLSELKPNGEFVLIKNHQIHVYRQGDVNKPKLVFMSGSGTISPIYDFKILYEKLLSHFRIIVIEKFGYGYSDIYNASFDIDSLVSIYRETLDEVKEDGPFILLPHSMAGLEALRWKQLFPEEVSAIIGIDMAFPNIYKSWSEKELHKRILTMKLAKKLMIHNFFDICGIEHFLSFEERKQVKLLSKRNGFNDCYINEGYWVIKNAKTVDELSYKKCPMLLFVSNGKQTSKNWIEKQQEFANITNAMLVSFDCGHYIHHFKSDEMIAYIKNFI